LKLEANKIAAMESRARERVIWSAEARAELCWRFFIRFFLGFDRYGQPSKRGCTKCDLSVSTQKEERDKFPKMLGDHSYRTCILFQRTRVSGISDFGLRIAERGRALRGKW